MPIRLTVIACLLVVLLTLAGFLGCAGKPKVCAVSPIDIEEVKSDTRDLDQELTVVQERLKKAQDDLATWQARLAERKAEIPVLEAELARAKKASGVTEEMVVDIEPKPQQAQDIQIMPRSD